MTAISANPEHASPLLSCTRDAVVTASRVGCHLVALLAFLLVAESACAIDAVRSKERLEPGIVRLTGQFAESGLELRSSDELSAPGAVSDRRRELLLLQLRTLQMRNDQHHDQQALSDKIGWLEADVAELKRAAERLQIEAAALTTPVSDSTATAGSPVGASAIAAGREAAVDTALPGASSVRINTRQSTQAAGVDPGEWATYAGLATTAFLLSFLLFKHQRTVRREPAPDALNAAPPSLVGDQASSRRQGDDDSLPLAMSGGIRKVTSESGAIPVVPLERQAPALARDAAEPERTAAGTALDLAEIMLSFGRVSGAAKTLQEYVAANPQEALRPWIRLLEIYQANGMREEFEAMALKLNRNFNVEVIHWPTDEKRADPAAAPLATDPRKAVTLETITHVRDRLLSLWGGSECLPYLEQLLRDNRNGQRAGFTLPVVEELLFLIDLLAAREAAD